MMDLIIFLTNGQTLRFERVTEFNSNEAELRFNYHGVSTNTTRAAIFMKENIAGFAPSK